MKTLLQNNQLSSFRSLNNITDKELKDICLLSGEVINDFSIQKIERECDEDENCRYITVNCKSDYKDGSFTENQICINSHFVVWTVNLNRNHCDNVCGRDVIANQYEVMLYLLIKGFSIDEEIRSVNLFIEDKEKWHKQQSLF